MNALLLAVLNVSSVIFLLVLKNKQNILNHLALLIISMVEPMQIDNTCCICTTKNKSHTLKHLRFYDVFYWSAIVTNGLIILANSPVPSNSLFKTNPLTAII